MKQTNTVTDHLTTKTSLGLDSRYANIAKGSLQEKNSKKSDIVTIRSATYLPYLISDIKISDICFKNLYLPTLVKEWRIIGQISSLKTLFILKSSQNMDKID